MLLLNSRLSSSYLFPFFCRNILDLNFFKLKSSTMSSDVLSLYEEAVYALNGLQSNVSVLQKARQERSANAYLNLINTERHLKTLGIEMEDLEALNIIHVAGTKGKGSTCAFTESILRNHGYKTGFYSSPHLISVNERIRINGLPMDKGAFTGYFWKVYRTIECSLKDDEAMPSYFMFLTIMAFYVFVMERVEAAVIEVGIGGLYDCTNIIRKPVAVGITTLGIDHVSILGNSIAEIAAQKAGIFKSGVPAFTVPQVENAMKVLREQSQAIGCSLTLSPPVEAYEQSFCLGVAGAIQYVNASLALQLSKAWLNHHGKSCSTLEILNHKCENNLVYEDSSYLPLPLGVPFNLDAKFQEGLKSCVWLGRFQTVEKNKLTFYLDGAHTQQSIIHCIKWFNDVSQQHRMKYQPPILRILLFNCTGERKAESLLDPLADSYFDLVIFSPNRLTVTKDSSSDLSNFMVDPEKEMQQCITNKEIWNHLIRSMHENEVNLILEGACTPQLKSETDAFNSENSLLFSCLSSAINWISADSSATRECDLYNKSNIFTQMLNNASHIQVLVTGSLHLVGGVLKLIQS